MDKRKRLYVDFHIIQTVPPSCVNRDDTGSPKTAIYGGVMRARVSSQSWKHAMRGMFKDLMEQEDIGNRTKMVKALISNQIKNISPDSAADKLAEEVMKTAGLTVDKKKGTTGALFFISEAQVKSLAELAVFGEGKDKEKVKQAMRDNPSADMALFGRMVADDPSLNYDAASQVAHAISTHAVHNEYDFFTAVDDCAPDDNAGAGHLGTVEYNSSTLYRYATVNVEELKQSVGSKVTDYLKGFAEAFVLSMPTGKQNTFANRTMPDLVYMTIRNDQPINMSGAFEKPISGKDGYAQASATELFNYATEIYNDFACEPVQTFCCGRAAEIFGEKTSFIDAINELAKVVNGLLED